MPIFGGPTEADTIASGELVCHYGNGVVVGKTFVTMARVGLGGGGDAAATAPVSTVEVLPAF